MLPSAAHQPRRPFTLQSITLFSNSFARFHLTALASNDEILQIPLHQSEMSHVLATITVADQSDPTYTPAITYDTPFQSNPPHRSVFVHARATAFHRITASYVAPFLPRKILYTLHIHPEQVRLRARLVLDNASRFDFSDVSLSLSDVSYHPIASDLYPPRLPFAQHPVEKYVHPQLPLSYAELTHASKSNNVPCTPFVFGASARSSQRPIFSKNPARRDTHSNIDSDFVDANEDKPSDEEPNHSETSHRSRPLQAVADNLDLSEQMSKLNCSVTTAQGFHVGTRSTDTQSASMRVRGALSSSRTSRRVTASSRDCSARASTRVQIADSANQKNPTSSSASGASCASDTDEQGKQTHVVVTQSTDVESVKLDAQVDRSTDECTVRENGPQLNSVASGSKVGKRNIVEEDSTHAMSEANVAQSDMSPSSQRSKTRKMRSVFRFEPTKSVNILERGGDALQRQLKVQNSPNQSASSNFQFKTEANDSKGVDENKRKDSVVQLFAKGTDDTDGRDGMSISKSEWTSNSREVKATENCSETPCRQEDISEPLCHTISGKVSVLENMSTVVPFLNEKCEGGVMLLYSPDLNADYACTSIWMKNSSEVALLSGHMAVYLQCELAAEVGTKSCAAGGKLYIPGGENRICKVSVTKDDGKYNLDRRRCMNGQLYAEISQIRKTTYTICIDLDEGSSTELCVLHRVAKGCRVVRSELRYSDESEAELVSHDRCGDGICGREDTGCDEREISYQVRLESCRSAELTVYHRHVERVWRTTEEVLREEGICELERLNVIDSELADEMRAIGRSEAQWGELKDNVGSELMESVGRVVGDALESQRRSVIERLW